MSWFHLDIKMRSCLVLSVPCFDMRAWLKAKVRSRQKPWCTCYFETGFEVIIMMGKWTMKLQIRDCSDTLFLTFTVRQFSKHI